MPTSIADISVGSMLFGKGIAFDYGDLNVNATAASRVRSANGKGKHPMLVIDRTDEQITVVGLCTFDGAQTLTGTVIAASLPFWIPVIPHTQEVGMAHAPISLVPNPLAEDDAGWIYVRRTYTFPGPIILGTLLTSEQTLASVNTVRVAIGMPILV